MSKGIFIGSGNVAKEAERAYIGVEGKAHEVIKGYIGVDGVARRFYVSRNWLENVEVTEHSFSVSFTSLDGVIADGVLQNNNLNF